MAVVHKAPDSFVPIAVEDLEQFLKDIDCIELVKKLREDGLATCISIPPGQTFTTVCEKMRQVAFSASVRDRIVKHLDEKVESVIMTNRMSLALTWLGLLIDEARVTEDIQRKTVLDDFMKEFFQHSDKLRDECKRDPETAVLAQSLKMSEEDVPNATAALSYFSRIRELFRDCPSRDSAPGERDVDDSVWINQLLSCGKTVGVDLYPYSDILEMSANQVKHIILQKQMTLMKECRISVEPTRPHTAVIDPSAEPLPASFYSTDHLKPSAITPIQLPPLQVYPGDQVFSFDKSVNHPWKLWNVKRVNRNLLTLTDPSAGNDPKTREEQMQMDKLATFKNAAAEGMWLPVGTLVVAWFDDGTNATPFGYTDKYYHGIVIEAPCVWNRFRYMVFFEKGDFGYVRSDFVCRKFSQSEDNVGQLTHMGDLNFLRRYFELWPKRPFVMADVGQTLSCSYYGRMQSCVVEEIDCSLFRVRCCENSRLTEWIHRGSRRFEIMEHFIVSDLQETGGATAPRRPHRTKWSSATVEVANWQTNGPVNSAGELLPNDDTFCQTRNVFRKHKPVAKKSSISGLVVPRYSRQKRSKSPPASRAAEELQGSLVDEVFSNRRNGRPDSRAAYVSHQCSERCVSDDEKAFFDKGGPKGRNPLAIPLLCGWARALSTAPPHMMMYYAPCGLAIKNISEMDRYLVEVKSRLTIDLFAFEREIDITKKYVTTKPIGFWEDLSESAELHQPVLLVNKFALEKVDPFKYTNDCPKSAQITSLGESEDYLAGCDCTDGCRDPTKCFCRRLTNVTAGSTSASGYVNRRLPNHVPTGIYECNSKCKCTCNPDGCMNRVVQRGMRVRVQVFKTDGKGWGVQAIDDLPAGHFLCTYSGEILTSSEADELGSQRGDEYLYDLDFLDTAIRYKQYGEGNDAASETSSEDSGAAMEVSSTGGNGANTGSHGEAYSASLVRLYHGTPENYSFVMDAKICGNISRFFNHSCEPNLMVQSVFVNNHDLRLPVIAFFTARRIRAGEELTWDYSYEPGSVPGRIILCKCGTQSCRGRLL